MFVFTRRNENEKYTFVYLHFIIAIFNLKKLLQNVEKFEHNLK